MRIVHALMHAHEVRADAPCAAFGIASLDRTLGGGLALGRLHEFYATEPDEGAAAIGFVMALTSHLAKDGQLPFLWLRPLNASRHSGVLQARGWLELGGNTGMALLGVVPDTLALLRAAVDALCCRMLSLVIAESWGAMRELDLTASRRLVLATEKSGGPLLLLRLDAAPTHSAAQTRWQVVAPSHALPDNAPGRPTFDVTLLSQKSGPCGQS